MSLTLTAAQSIMTAALEKGREMNLKPLTVAVLDAGGQLQALLREDGTSTLRADIAQGKASGALALGINSRAIGERAENQAYFVQACNALAGGRLVPVAGGVLIKDGDGQTLGAVGITGDSSDNDEACAIAGIQAAGLVAFGA